jgi:hypothetical protein
VECGTLLPRFAMATDLQSELAAAGLPLDRFARGCNLKKATAGLSHSRALAAFLHDFCAFSEDFSRIFVQGFCLRQRFDGSHDLGVFFKQNFQALA